jgi:hypothetical protein
MLVLNRSLLNSEYALINALKPFASTDFMCNLHVIFLSNITLDILLFLQMGSSIQSM